jgi:hypothetical protein
MQNTSGNQGQNQSTPNRDQQSKGGQHSHQGNDTSNMSKTNANENENDQRGQNRPGQEASVKGGQSGQSSQSGGKK